MARKMSTAQKKKMSRLAKRRKRYKSGPKKGQFMPGGGSKPSRKRRKPAKKRKPAKRRKRRKNPVKKAKPRKRTARRRAPAKKRKPAKRRRAPAKKRSMRKRRKRNPTPVDVAILNPDIMRTAEDVGAATLGLTLGCLTGPLFHALYDKYVSPRIKEGEALLPADLGTPLISSGVPLAAGLAAKKFGLTRIGNGMLYGSGALFVLWLLQRIRSLDAISKAEPESVGSYIRDLNMGPLGYTEPALLFASQEAGRAMIQSPHGELYSIAPGDQSPIWELVFPDQTTLSAEYLGDVRTETGDAYAVRERSTGRIMLLPIETYAKPGGEVYARPMSGIVSDYDRLAGIVPSEGRLAGIVPDTASPRSYVGSPDEGLQLEGVGFGQDGDPGHW